MPSYKEKTYDLDVVKHTGKPDRILLISASAMRRADIVPRCRQRESAGNLTEEVEDG